MLVQIIAGLLANRTDAAAILMDTAAAIAPTKPPAAHGSTDQPGGQPGITHQLIWHVLMGGKSEILKVSHRF